MTRAEAGYECCRYETAFIAHAAPGGRTEAFARKLAAEGKPVLTLEGPGNGNLEALGARTFTPEDMGEALFESG